MKALAKANASGQRIYQITQANSATILPNIHHDPATMDEIRASLAVSKEVITHTDAVSVPCWSGAGYIILDSVTGDGAYKIGGGANGGWLGLISGFAVGLTMLIPALWPAALLITWASIVLVAMLEYWNWLDGKGPNPKDCFAYMGIAGLFQGTAVGALNYGKGIAGIVIFLDFIIGAILHDYFNSQKTPTFKECLL